MSFLGNILLLFCTQPSPWPLNLTIVQRITFIIVIFLTTPFLAFAETLSEPTGTMVGTDSASSVPALEIQACQKHDQNLDRLWVISTRSLSTSACCASLEVPAFKVSQLDRCGQTRSGSWQDFLVDRPDNRPVLIQTHGNRMTSEEAIERGLFIYRNIVPYSNATPFDYVIFSWPSEKEGILLGDGREKAERTDAEGLYLAWIIRELTNRDVPIALSGFSFGGRVATGALHALAGGTLGGRALPGEHQQGASVSVGLVAPALEDDWLRAGRYHGLATKNIKQMSILYNQRDAVLKRYWLLEKVRENRALGFTGPKGLALGFDSQPIPVFSRDCSPTLGIRHDEEKYYTEDCRAGRQMAKLVNSAQ